MTNYKYYNQNNFANVPYPSPDLPKATVKSGGCGVCCASMIVENLTSHSVGPKLMASYARNKKARVNGGTDMNVLAKAICIDYGLSFTATEDENKLVSHLKSGGMAIANVGGNHGTYKGLYSDGGHYVVIVGITLDGWLKILDPGYYAGKYDKVGRKGKVVMDGNVSLCPVATLAADTEISPIEYWLFKRKEVDKDMKVGVEMPEVTTTLNGAAVDKVVILNVDGKDTTYIPAVVLRNAGMKVEWDPGTRTVKIEGGK